MKKSIKPVFCSVLLALAAVLAHKNAPAQACTVNLLIAYTDVAADSLKGDQSAIKQIIGAVQNLNTAYVYSAVNQQVVLVRTVRLDDVESGCFASDLNDFQANTFINALRDKYHADIAALVFTNKEFCGLPYLDNGVANASTAYCAVNYKCMISSFALSHQVAHLYGCSHYIEFSELNDAVYPYGHGYQWSFEGNGSASFSTIMGIEDDDFCGTDSTEACDVIPYFSNPNIQYQGVPLGIKGVHDNAQVLNQNANIIGSFKLLPNNQLSLTDTVNVHNIALATAKDTLGTGQRYMVIDSAKVIFKAGKKIILNPGFMADEGVHFETVVKDIDISCGQ